MSSSRICNVIVITDGLVEQNYLFYGDEAVDEAEEKFIDLCSELLPDFNATTTANLEEMIEQSYIEIDDNSSICLTFPEIEKVEVNYGREFETAAESEWEA